MQNRQRLLGAGGQNLLIRSADRDLTAASASSQDFKVQFPELVSGRFLLRWATVPNAVYTINSDNNILYLRKGATDVQYTLTPSNYTAQTLATALTALLAGNGYVTAGQTVTFEYASEYLKLRITLSAGAEFTIFTSKSPSSIHSVLGLPDGLDASWPEAYSLTPGQATLLPNVVSLARPISLGLRIAEARSVGYQTARQSQYRELNIDGKTVRFVKGPMAGQATFLVPFLAAQGAYASTSQDNHQQCVYFSNPTRTLSCSVINPDTQNTINLNGAQWEMLLTKVGDEQL